jgi:uncharacterized membrane protein (DUF106 family)
MNMADLSMLTVVPVATAFLMVVAFVITLVNQIVYRALINHFIGWNEYHMMRKEMNEYRKESMAAARSNDKKQLEKLKKKESQNRAMQAKMMKPQMAQMGISFIYLIVWYFLRPLFTDSNGAGIAVAYVPGFENGLSLFNGWIPLISPGGGLLLFTWYMPVAFFVGMLVQKILGTMPIE